MILRQTNFDPVRNRLEIKEIELRLEDVRLPGELHSKVRIIGLCQDMSNMSEPSEQVQTILDNKRTYSPLPQSYVKEVGETIVLFDIKSLSPKIGDPLAFLFDKSQESFGIVSEVGDNYIKVIGLSKPAVRGSIVQNLKDRYHQPKSNLGISAKLSQPEGLSVMVKPSKNLIEIMITPPLHQLRISFYDIYVRNQDFQEIDPFWVPDVLDSPIKTDQVTVSTYNGTSSLEIGKTYWITAIAKDRSGLSNVNESPVLYVEKIIL